MHQIALNVTVGGCALGGTKTPGSPHLRGRRLEQGEKHSVSTWLVTISACVELVLSLGFAGIRQFAHEKTNAIRSHEFISGYFHFVCAQGHSKCDWVPVLVAHRTSLSARGRIIASERAERNSGGNKAGNEWCMYAACAPGAGAAWLPPQAPCRPRDRRQSMHTPAFLELTKHALLVALPGTFARVRYTLAAGPWAAFRFQEKRTCKTRFRT